MTISTANIFDKFYAVFSKYRIDFGLIQNTYQIDFLFSLEIKRILLICLSDTTWYNMYRIHLGVEQSQIETLIGPLSFSTLKPLLLFLIFECYLWLLGFLTVFQGFDELAFSLCWMCFVHFKNSAILTLINQLNTDAVIKRYSTKWV